jgi:uncharacterized coiled-coil protein SlyX
MDFDAAIKSVGSQLSVVGAAPIPFMILLAVLSIAIWQICRWYYDGRVSSLEARLAFKDDEIITLKHSIATLEAKRTGNLEHLKATTQKMVRKEASPEELALVKMAKAYAKQR